MLLASRAAIRAARTRNPTPAALAANFSLFADRTHRLEFSESIVRDA